jgi:hypothetical protein
VKGAHTLSDLVSALTGNFDDLVEVEVEVTEVGADDIPVGMFVDQLQGDEVNENLLKVRGKGFGGLETGFSVFELSSGLSGRIRNVYGVSHATSPSFGVAKRRPPAYI